MGYLSCKAESSTSIKTAHHPKHPIEQNQQLHNQEHEQEHEQEQSHYHNHHQKPIKIQQFQYTDLELATSYFSTQKLLGRGSHGLVYKAVLPSGRLVAVKKPSRRDPSSEFDNELTVLSHLNSPRFVNLLGYSSDRTTDRLLVVEYMSNGTLYDVLHSNPKPPGWGKRVRFAMQVAKGIEILHSQYPPVIHRDVKSANVLIDRNNNARLGDFGLALRCHTDDYKLRSTPPAGTIGYLDPCYVTPDNLSTKNDVFSFGILLLEIISGRKAIDIGRSPPSVVDWAIPLIKKGKILSVFDPRISPPRDPVVRKQLCLIAAKCVRSCRERRPTMKQIVEALEALCKLVPLRSWNGIVANPCLMVESVGHPVESGSAIMTPRFKGFECGNLDDVEGRFANLSRNSRRVFSDLGFRSNLMDLMAEPDGGSAVLPRSSSVSQGSSLRVVGRRSVAFGDVNRPRRNKP